MSAQAPTKSSARTAWLVVALAAGLHVASAAWHVGFGGMNSDEGFYAVATRAVAQGEVPYRDFGFSQPPLVLYANCLPLSAVGFGLFAQRAVNGLWAALALALAARWLAGRTRWEWGVALAVGFSLSAPWMYFIHLGKTYGFTTLLVMLAAWAFLTLRAGPRRNAVLGVLAALGVGTRLGTAPFFGLLWLLALWPGRRATAREVLAAVLSAGLGAASQNGSAGVGEILGDRPPPVVAAVPGLAGRMGRDCDAGAGHVDHVRRGRGRCPAAAPAGLARSRSDAGLQRGTRRESVAGRRVR